MQTKHIQSLTKENAEDLKNDLVKYCVYDKNIPAFIFLKHKDSNGRFGKNYSNYDANEFKTIS